ncbi:hypothetical protein CEXT_657241 [Caerostris extrusa]|uniref:Uncharacterized protein n=1 Tax=Caerostris extrusa TaxID=172846 RepID=A0AAV4MW92_CAEEX|nr:hypothetical protein CEXT_657241 [Caerostris extrusa]
MLSSSDDIRSPSVLSLSPIQIWLWLYFAQRTRHGVPAPLQDRRRGRPDGTEGRRRPRVQAQGQGSPRPPQPHGGESVGFRYTSYAFIPLTKTAARHLKYPIYFMAQFDLEQ